MSICGHFGGYWDTRVYSLGEMDERPNEPDWNCGMGTSFGVSRE